MKAKLGSEGLMGHICWFLGAVFAVLGVVGDAVNLTIGLESISWFLLAIVAFVASITSFIGWAVAWYLKTTHSK